MSMLGDAVAEGWDWSDWETWADEAAKDPSPEDLAVASAFSNLLERIKG